MTPATATESSRPSPEEALSDPSSGRGLPVGAILGTLAAFVAVFTLAAALRVAIAQDDTVVAPRAASTEQAPVTESAAAPPEFTLGAVVELPSLKVVERRRARSPRPPRVTPAPAAPPATPPAVEQTAPPPAPPPASPPVVPQQPAAPRPPAEPQAGNETFDDSGPVAPGSGRFDDSGPG